MASYRICHFLPQPIHGGRFPLGAVVEVDGQPMWVAARRLPGSECLGGRDAADLMGWWLRALERPDQFERLDGGVLGPHIWFDVPKQVPSDVPNAPDWVAVHVLPRAPADSATSRGQTRHSRRATLGLQFLQARNLSARVKKTFAPKTDGREVFRDHAAFLPSVSQWTGCEERLIMLEPIAPAKPGCEADVEHVVRSYHTYGLVRRDLGLTSEALQLSSYLLPGGDAAWRRGILRELQAVTDRVVDTHDERDLQRWAGELVASG